MKLRTTVNPGDTFGFFTVIKEVDGKVTPDWKFPRRFLCECYCGVIKEVNLSNLMYLGTKSCGCMRKKENKAKLWI